MCQFKSGIILKERIFLCPMENERHCDLLRNLGIKDTLFNASHVFVRAELTPTETTDVSKWEYRVDQDIVPSWYSEDPKKYEKEFRDAVKEWMRNYRFTEFCGKLCINIKSDAIGDYWMLVNPLFYCGYSNIDNNYINSIAREGILNCNFLQRFEEMYGYSLVPCNEVGDIMTLRSFELDEECKKNIPHTCSEWLATSPNNSRSRLLLASPVEVVEDEACCADIYGNIDYIWVSFNNGIRPFFIVRDGILFHKHENIEELQNGDINVRFSPEEI